MRHTAKAVIGASYGDEGKGLMTDYHIASAGRNGIVVRFNGGAQLARGTPYIPASNTARRLAAQCPAGAEYF